MTVPPDVPGDIATEPGAERRQFRRFSIAQANAQLFRTPAEACPLPDRNELVLRLGTKLKNWAKSAVDISEGGLKIVITDRIDAGTAVYGKIAVDQFAEEIEIQGQIRWCFQKSRTDGTFYAGVMFTDLTPSQMRRIALVRECLVYAQYKALRAIRKKEKGDDSPEVE